MAASRHLIEETIDAVLQQQLISSSFRIIDRVQKRALLVPGTKAAFFALKSAIMNTIPMETQAVDFNKIAENMAREFGVARGNFDAKLASLPRSDPSVDARLQLVLLLSVLREQWQNDAYELVIEEVKAMALKRRCDASSISRDVINKLLSSCFGPEFSHLVNLYVIRRWSRITGVPIKIRSARMTILNTLVANVVRMVQKEAAGESAVESARKPPALPPGPPKTNLQNPSPPGLPPSPPAPPGPR